MHFSDCNMGKEGEACDCAKRLADSLTAPAAPEGATMIEARRVGRLVVFYPKRWRAEVEAVPFTPEPRAPRSRGEWVALVYAGANPRGYAYFHEAEKVALAYEAGPSEDEPLARWDVDAGRWAEVPEPSGDE